MKKLVQDQHLVGGGFERSQNPPPCHGTYQELGFIFKRRLGTGNESAYLAKHVKNVKITHSQFLQSFGVNNLKEPVQACNFLPTRLQKRRQCSVQRTLLYFPPALLLVMTYPGFFSRTASEQTTSPPKRQVSAYHLEQDKRKWSMVSLR